jgi:hypothetical protein
MVAWNREKRDGGVGEDGRGERAGIIRAALFPNSP